MAVCDILFTQRASDVPEITDMVEQKLFLKEVKEVEPGIFETQPRLQ